MACHDKRRFVLLVTVLCCLGHENVDAQRRGGARMSHRPAPRAQPAAPRRAAPTERHDAAGSSRDVGRGDVNSKNFDNRNVNSNNRVNNVRIDNSRDINVQRNTTVVAGRRAYARPPYVYGG